MLTMYHMVSLSKKTEIKCTYCFQYFLSSDQIILCCSYTIDNTNDENEFRVNLNVTIQLDDNTVLYKSVLLHDTLILRVPCDWNTGFYITGNNIYVCVLNQRECEILSLLCVHCDICLKISKFDIASSETTSQLKLILYS